MVLPCSIDRRRQKRITDFAAEHLMHIERWYLYEDNVVQLPGDHNDAAFDRYLRWFQECARLRLRPAWT